MASGVTLMSTHTVSSVSSGPHLARKLRVLLLAESCNPRWPSVPLEAYSLAKALSEREDLDITLVSQVRNCEALESDPIAARVHLHFINTEFVARPFYGIAEWLRGGSQLSWTTLTAFSWPANIMFEKMVYRRFVKDLRAGSFDLVHRLTPISSTMGSPLASLVKVPIVIGPLNGGLPWPSEYPEIRKQEREWLVPLRGLYRWLPYYQSTYRHAGGVIAGSWSTASELPSWFRGRRYYLPENGLDPGRIPLVDSWTPPTSGKKFQFVTIGRLVPYKGMDLILQSMARSAVLRRGAELVIIGDGPFRTTLEGQASELELSPNVTFAGWIEHTKLRDRLDQAQAFVFPSLREFGGGVVLEAMASGLPPIVVDYGGPGELVTDECGIRLPMVPRVELIGRLSRAMEMMLEDPDMCRRMSEAGIDRVRREFTWSRKAAQIVAIYRDLLGLPDGDSKLVPVERGQAGISFFSINLI
jgi:glycosyltransferase involved in cell wall biosynthesis